MRYRLQVKTAHGKIDLAFKGKKIAVFVDGCFWHGCPAHYVRPRSSSEFWADKLRQNVERDSRQTLALEGEGWRVFRIWEHMVFISLDEVTQRIQDAVRGAARPVTENRRVIAVEAIDATGNQERRIHVDLRNLEKVTIVEQQRHTRKWKRPRVE